MAKSDTVRAFMHDKPSWTKDITILVRVGTDAASTDFHVHQSKLAAHSDFFAAALSKSWKEASEKVVKLPEEEAEMFSVFVDFIYSGKLFVEQHPKKLNNPTTDLECERLSDIWIMADRLQSTSLKDAVADCICMRDRLEEVCPLNMQRAIYPASSSTAGLRRLLVDCAMFCWSAEDLETRIREPGMAEFSADVAVALHRRSLKSAPWTPTFKRKEQDWCKYHEHGEHKKCWRTMFPN